MGRQRNMLQMRKKYQEIELNEMEETKILDAEFKTMVIIMLKNLKGRINNLSENLNKEIASIKKDIETKKY